MPDAHALLSPSASHRWINCPASIQMTELVGQRVGDEASPYAKEGTIAHALAEIEGRYAFGQMSRTEYFEEYEAWRMAANLDIDTLKEMEDHIENFVAYVKERAALNKNSVVMFEQRLKSGVADCWGTSDVVIVSPYHVEVIDLKYGQGYYVSPENNPQIMIYGLGAYDEFGTMLGDPKHIVLSIYQPRVPNGIGSWSLTPEALLEWRETVLRPAAAATREKNPRFGPSEQVCWFCPAAGVCKVRGQVLAGEDFSAPYVDEDDPRLLSRDDYTAILDRIPEIEKWIADIRETAFRKAYEHGQHIPGYKIVKSSGRRYITDPTAAIQTLIDAGYTAEQVATFKVKGIGDLEKLLGKGNLEGTLGDLVQKTEGSPSLVKDTDKRPSIDRNSEAAGEFRDS